MTEKLSTGEVAKAAGVHVETLRFYERRGILKEPERRPSGYREYPGDAVQIVRFIKRAQGLGFTLDEIEELLSFRESSTRQCAEVRGAAVAKLSEIEGKIKNLRGMQRALSALVKSCSDDDSVPECPILEALDDLPRPGPKRT